jgi:hypothetical protein
MSVLIEALTLVVRQLDLDLRYPGGTDAFLEATLALERPPRFACNADRHLVNLSFYDPGHLEPAVALLRSHGFADVEDGKVVDMAYVEQRFGPTMPCDWLAWREHRDGFTCAWLAGTEPGDMAAPDDWTPERSRAMIREDIRDDAENMIKLADEDGIETWLDLSTGKQLIGLGHREAPESGGTVTASDSRHRPATTRDSFDTTPIEHDTRDMHEQPASDLLSVVRAALAAREVEHAVTEAGDDSPAAVTFPLRGDHTVYEFLVSIDEPIDLVVCCARIASRVPEARRPAVCELLTRINYALRIGSFEMDLRDGELIFRTAIDVEGGTLTPKMADSLVAISISTFEHWFPTIMRVVYGGASPEAAMTEPGEGE